MKKKVLFILLFIMILLCTACNGNVTRDIRHAGFSVSTEFKCDVVYPKSKNDTGYKKIKYFTSTNMIDSTGAIYEVSLSQVYENKMNCKKANTDILVKAIYDNKIIKATDNKYYYLSSENNANKYSVVPETDNSYELYNLLLKNDDVVKVVTADSSSGYYYILRDDGNIYSYKVSKDNYNSPLKITSISIVYDKSDYGSKIIDFNYAGQTASTYIRTEDKVYRMKVSNYDRCSKYADVACEYSFDEETVFEKYKDRIIIFNGSTLITDYKQVFTAN